jgi:RNA polymerase sigma factor (sigma-70 family)
MIIIMPISKEEFETFVSRHRDRWRQLALNTGVTNKESQCIITRAVENHQTRLREFQTIKSLRCSLDACINAELHPIREFFSTISGIRPDLLKYASKFGSTDPEDCVSKAIANVIAKRNVKKINDQQHLIGHLFKSTNHRVIDQIRAQIRAQTRAQELPILFVDIEDDSRPTQESLQIQKEGEKHLQHAIETLSDKNKAIVILHDLRELTFEECSEILHEPIGTLSSRRKRAFNILRKQLSAWRTLLFAWLAKKIHQIFVEPVMLIPAVALFIMIFTPKPEPNSECQSQQIDGIIYYAGKCVVGMPSTPRFKSNVSAKAPMIFWKGVHFSKTYAQIMLVGSGAWRPATRTYAHVGGFSYVTIPPTNVPAFRGGIRAINLRTDTVYSVKPGHGIELGNPDLIKTLSSKEREQIHSLRKIRLNRAEHGKWIGQAPGTLLQ